ncbi:hypothetical protein DYB26_000513 [Aphanomyces astaci]|uniref:RNA helicase n=1 Tax=Aphanomyces astaci TaxID=112090 RepID=A0A418F3Q9_APHAT|nr:hypothetical protein DYB26_000513 [Aphanomyces astaci]
MASLRQSALVVASVNSIGNGTELHRSVCALDALLQQIERIRPVTGKRDIGQHIRHECSCRRDLPIAMRLLQQAEYHIVYITAPTTAPRGDELKNFVRGGNVVVQFILLRSEVEDIQSTADSVMALVDATADMPSVSIVQSEDTLIDVRNTMKPWLRKLQAHMTAVVRWPPSSPDDMSATSLQLVLRSSFSLHETQESQWHLLHAGLAHLTALHVVPLDSVDGSVVIGLPLTSDAASDPYTCSFKMSVLFAPKRKRQAILDTAPLVPTSKDAATKEEDVSVSTNIVAAAPTPTTEPTSTTSILTTFADLGLDPWIAAKCKLLGLLKPTPVQANCIPPILAGRDVMGCAQTGSGKTAAFALPILHDLAKEIYGPFALVLTPTRELAYQIAEQFQALGSGLSLRTCVVVGGVDMMTQALTLQQRPHVLVATPGRLRDHMLRANPPNLKLIKYLVLDEADRLLTATFAKDLAYLLGTSVGTSHQTLLFSATMTADLTSLEKMAMTNPFRFDATPSATTVTTLKQSYLFVPAQIKPTYLLFLLQTLVHIDDDPDESSPSKKKPNKHRRQEVVGPNNSSNSQSMIVFVATCRMCQLLCEIAIEFNLPVVALHAVMGQSRRLAALGKFKAGTARILISTDVASRGLDIPDVSTVVNYDLPRDADDYIHRVGRTARAGRHGSAISLVTQHDIQLLHNIEAKVGKPLANYEDHAPEPQVLKLLNDVTTATRVAKMRLTEHGFDDRVAARKKKWMKK